MVIFGIPFPARSFHRFATDAARIWQWRTRHFSQKAREPFLHLVYFSCERDFEPLCLSLQSVTLFIRGLVKSTTVYIDDKSPFTEDQRQKLKSLSPGLKFGVSKEFAWASMGTLKTELNAFASVAAQARDDDYVVKVDSDILFFSDYKPTLFSGLGYDFIGDGHYEGYRYSQGGLYFMRAQFARHLVFNRVEQQVNGIVDRFGELAEDLVIYNLVKGMRKNILLTNLMLFPGEYENVRNFQGVVGKLFAAIHFVKTKHQMADYLTKRLPAKKGRIVI